MEIIYKKLIRRSIYGLALAMAALPLALSTWNWLLFGMHVVLCVMFSVALGVFNPTRSARDEESLIAVGISIMPIFMV